MYSLLILLSAATIAPIRFRQRPRPLERQAQAITIVRDDWGIAHVRGKTDADAVFGMIYAHAEDDFNRIETNYLNSMGRLVLPAYSVPYSSWRRHHTHGGSGASIATPP